MPRFMHPVHGSLVDVPDHDQGLIRYYTRDGWLNEQEHPGFGEPPHGTEAPLGQWAEIANDDPDNDAPGDPDTEPGTEPDVGTSLDL